MENYPTSEFDPMTFCNSSGMRISGDKKQANWASNIYLC